MRNGGDVSNEVVGIVHGRREDETECSPRVKHMHAPRIQHQVTDAGPPRRRGVLKVVATQEHRPMMLNAKLIYASGQRSVDGPGRKRDAHGCEVGKFAPEGGHIADLLEQPVIVCERVAWAGADDPACIDVGGGGVLGLGAL